HGLLEHLHAAGLIPGQCGAPRIGCIGSRAKWTSFRDGCLEAGLPEALVEAVVCPIGLNIGAETPEEIAVAVAAAIMAAEAGLAPGEPTWRDAM
ncbi:MAG: XdhC family protein, partial [Candidatus Thermoplasmatota archaeon]|nr:XdhC family protein [Candidatus Thermoplasmatota archaeon]